MNDWKNLFPKENRYYETENGILYCGDSVEILKKIPEKSIDLIVTDPPYDVKSKGDGGSINKKLKFSDSLKDIEKIDEGYNYKEYFHLIKKLQKKINVYFWTNKIYIPFYFDYFVLKNQCLFDILIWNKTNAIPSYNNKYLTDCEYLLYFKEKGAYNKPKNYEDAKTVYYLPINSIDKKKWKHPTIKPLKIIETIIKNSSKNDNIILDFFMGSGTTAIACEKLNRRWIGIEIDKKYCEISKQRIKEIIKDKKRELNKDLFK